MAGVDVGGAGASAAAPADVSCTASSCTIATIDLSCISWIKWILSDDPGAEGTAEWVIPHNTGGKTSVGCCAHAAGERGEQERHVMFSFHNSPPASGISGCAVLLQAVDAASGVCTTLHMDAVASGTAPADGGGSAVPTVMSSDKLRAATADGAQPLRTVVCIFESPARLAPGATLTFQEAGAAAADSSAACLDPQPLSSWPRPLPALSFNMMLDGPFTDAVVRAPGGRSWRVHRVLLAAASPALAAMFGGDLLEGRTAEVTLRTRGGATEEEEAAAVELLLRHIYGADKALSVPLCVAPPLFALSQSYLARSDLATWLLAAMLAVCPDAAAMCRLGPLAHALCPEAWEGSLRRQCGAMLEELLQLPEFSCWPFECFEGALRHGRGLVSIRAASSWITAQVQQHMDTDTASRGSRDGEAAAVAAAAAAAAGAQAMDEAAESAAAPEAFEVALWRRVLPLLQLKSLSAAELAQVRREAPAAAHAAGLDAVLLDAVLPLAVWLQVAAEGTESDLAAARARIRDLEALVVQWQEQAQWAQRL